MGNTVIYYCLCYRYALLETIFKSHLAVYLLICDQIESEKKFEFEKMYLKMQIQPTEVI